MALNVQAAVVTFNPDPVALTVEPGTPAVAKIVVNSNSRAPHRLDLRVGSELAPGSTIPRGWISPLNVSLTTRRGSSATTNGLNVLVPADTPGGTYSAVVTSPGYAGHRAGGQ
ncbi:MAG: hypothetical protein KAS94_02810 [Desulfobulbaceae bacterium]|nr:hypothetical protein [Desulfobulbaceae bacterium]